LDDFEKTDIEKLKLDYKIPSDYFIVSNGFLKHKNHLVVLKALKVLQKQNKWVHIVFTGKMEAYADSSYIDELKDFIKDNSLGENVSLLGIIPRDHQLCIMKNARAVLQPSMFEGWNTTIEDAKSLQVPIIASSIAVHKEQLEEKGIYFDPADENELAQTLLNFTPKNGRSLYTDYNERIKIFARSFLNIFKNGKN
jgi:glycosyltransferase involved in cell wall biosynthesis